MQWSDVSKNKQKFPYQVGFGQITFVHDFCHCWPSLVQFLWSFFKIGINLPLKANLEHNYIMYKSTTRWSLKFTGIRTHHLPTRVFLPSTRAHTKKCYACNNWNRGFQHCIKNLKKALLPSSMTPEVQQLDGYSNGCKRSGGTARGLEREL